MPVSFDTNAFGQVSGELQLPLDGDRVAWSPNLVFPGLGEGDRLDPPDTPARTRADPGPRRNAARRRTRHRSLLAARHPQAAVGEVSSPSPEQNTEQVQLGFPPHTPTGTSGLELAFNGRLAGQPGGQLVAAPASQGGDAAKSHGHRHQQARGRHAGAYHDRSEAPAGRDRRARRPVRGRRRAGRDRSAPCWRSRGSPSPGHNLRGPRSR